MKILSRYVLRLHVAPFLFAITALTFIFLLDQVGDQFARLVGKGLEWTVIAEVFLYSIPFIVAMTLPMAVLVAVLYTFNKLASDNEIAAMKANGVHLPRVLVSPLVAAVLLAGGLVWFNDALLPEANHELQVLLSSVSQKKPTFVLRERAVNEVKSEELFLQAARIDRKTNGLTDVVIYDERKPRRSRTIYADGGSMAYNEARTDLFLTLWSGVMQESRAEEAESYQRMHFDTLVMRVPGVTNRLQRDEMGSYRGDREMSIAQMEREVRDALLRREETEAEMARFAEVVAGRLLGRELEETTESGREAPAGAPGGAGPDGGSGADGPGTARDTSPRAARDTTPGAAPGDRAATIRDSLLAAARERGEKAALGVGGARGVASQFRSYESRHTAALVRANRFRVEIQKKYSIPAACVIFVLIGAPLGIRFRRGGVGMVVGLSLGFFCAYYVALVGGEKLAEELILTPFWAMWTPNVLFGLVGLGLLWRAVRAG